MKFIIFLNDNYYQIIIIIKNSQLKMKKSLQNKEMKNTIQKLKVLEYLKFHKNHPSAEEIYQEIKKEIPTITLATVYRILNNLVENGKVIKIEFNNKSFFDLSEESHYHFICVNCKNIYDIYDYELKNLIEKSLKSRIENRNISGYSLIFYGMCENCKK